MTKLNLVNKHWLNIQCSACRHDVSVPVQQFINLGVNDIFEVKAKSKCKQCGRKGDAEIVIAFLNESGNLEPKAVDRCFPCRMQNSSIQVIWS